VVEDEQIDIKYPDARVDCSRIYTIEHYSVVRKIGRIDKKGLPLLEECFRLAMNVPLEVAETQVCCQLYTYFICFFIPFGHFLAILLLIVSLIVQLSTPNNNVFATKQEMVRSNCDSRYRDHGKLHLKERC